MRGFKTSKGSTYQVLPDGRTVRTKRSAGRGQGETMIPHAVLYVSDKVLPHLIGPASAGTFFKLGYAAPNGKSFFSFGAGAPTVPEGWQPWMVVACNKTGKTITHGPAKAQPEVGLCPVEATYTPDGLYHNHVGNPIVEIY